MEERLQCGKKSEHIVGFRVELMKINSYYQFYEGDVALWCNPLTLQAEQSGGEGSDPDRAPPLERHDKGSRTRLDALFFCDPSAWR